MLRPRLWPLLGFQNGQGGGRKTLSQAGTGQDTVVTVPFSRCSSLCCMLLFEHSALGHLQAPLLTLPRKTKQPGCNFAISSFPGPEISVKLEESYRGEDKALCVHRLQHSKASQATQTHGLWASPIPMATSSHQQNAKSEMGRGRLGSWATKRQQEHTGSQVAASRLACLPSPTRD